jgi:DNA-binding NarL/FixJ family response regulator
MGARSAANVVNLVGKGLKTMSRSRILLGDDHALVLEGMRSVLARDFDIVGSVANGRELVEASQQLKPDAVVLDISMPVLNGVEAARQIKTALPATKLVFVTQAMDRAYVQAAFQVGASAYVSKQSVAVELITALQQALKGTYFLSASLRETVLKHGFNENRNPAELFGFALTTRQREILQLIAEGKNNKEIANLLKISVKTVDFHKARLADHVGLHTTAELTRYAIANALV